MLALTVARSRPRATALALLAALALLGVLGPATVARAASPPGGPVRHRIATATPVPPGDQVIGAVAGSTSLSATVTLAPRDPAGLAAYAQVVSTSGPAVDRRYLSVAQFADRFGATPADASTVAAALRSQGLHVGALSANALSLPVSATAATLQHAFATTLARVALAGGGAAYADTTAPSLAAGTAALVSGVVGLDSLPAGVPQGLARAASAPALSTGGPGTCPAAAGHGNSARDIGTAYGLDGLWSQGDLGEGQTVALFELEPYTTSDIAAYQACDGTSATVAPVLVDGGPAAGARQSGEAALDIEDVAGLVPAARIDVYEGPNTSAGAYDTYARIVQADTAQVISTSWGLCEARSGSTPQSDQTYISD